MKNFSTGVLSALLLIGLISCSTIVRNPGCKSYNSQGICKQCSVRFYKDLNNICQPVNPNCKTYNPITGDCQSCYAGWGLLEGTCLPGLQNKVPLDPYCNKFQGSVCVKCSYGYYFGKDGLCTKINQTCQTFNEQTGQCLSCFFGFVLSDGKCNLAPLKPLDPNCNQFDSNNVCVKCSYGFYFSAGSCKKIDDSCKSFDLQKLHCSECYSGYVLNTNFECVKQAPKQNTNPYCAEWNNNQCLKCAKGSSFNQRGICVLLDAYCRSFDNLSGKCLKCYTGYVLGSNGNCQLEVAKGVSDPNCNSFGANGQCTKCSTGYYFNSLKICVKIDDNCKAFSVSQNKCMQCYPGYQLGSGGQCLVANVGITDVNCAQWKGTVCVKCSYGSVFDKSGKCVIIDPQCKEYDYVAGQCKSCYPGYTLDNSFNCVKFVKQVMDALCAEWLQDVCVKCSVGSYFNSQGKCDLSDANCRQTDQMTGKCKSCYSGYELTPQKTCIISVPSNVVDKLCSEWDSTGLLCLACSKGSFFNNLGVCESFDPLCKTSNEINGVCTSCYDGYVINTNGKCVQSQFTGVVDTLCAEFKNNICTKCSFGSYFDEKNICRQIDPYCAQFDNNEKKCKQCYPGMKINEGKCQIDINYQVSDPYCAQFQSGICMRCSTGYYFQIDGKCTAVDPLCASFNEMNGDCTSCFQGYDLDSGLCIPSQQDSKDPNCASFNPDNSCKKCSKGFFFDINSKLCQQVNPLCRTFDQSNGACLSCFSGYKVSGFECVIDQSQASSLCAESIDGICVRCASRAYLNEMGECQTVSQFCRTYSDINGDCLSCYIGFSLSNGKCVKSDVNVGCAQFGNNGNCLQCSFGYYLTQGRQCIQIDPHCANFNLISSKCEGCYNGYTLLEDKCQISKVTQQFQVDNCIAYNSDNKCIQCFDRFYLSNNQCKEVNVFCKTYDLVSGQCTGCYSSFKLSNGKCTK